MQGTIRDLSANNGGCRTLSTWTSFDHQKLNKARYDVHNPLDAVCFQRNVMEFMDLIRNTVVGGELSDLSNGSINNDRHLVDEFHGVLSYNSILPSLYSHGIMSSKIKATAVMFIPV